jgi:hypothetical protein
MTFTDKTWNSLCEGEIKQLQNEYNDSYVIEVQQPVVNRIENGGSKSRKSMRKTKKSKKSRKSRKSRKH